MKETRLYKIRKEIVEALSGTDKDFTKEKLGKAILLLSIPMVLEMLMESVFAIVDIYFISNLNNKDAVSAVGLTESFLTIVYALGIGLSMGTTALISRRIGEKRPKEASKTAMQAIIVGTVISLLIAVPGLMFSGKLLKIMGADNNIIEQGKNYTAIMLGGNIVIMLIFIINAIFRSAGDAAISMRVLWLANLINIVLDPCLIFGIGPFPELGLKGAAIATNIGRGTAVLYQFILLIKGKGRVQIIIQNIHLNYKIIKQLIKLSLGGIGQTIIATSSWIALVRIIAIFGSNAIAGYTIAIRIVMFSILPSWGLSNATATLVGQNLGANKPKRAEQSVWITGFINMALLGVIGLILIIFPKFFIGLFIANQDVISHGAVCLRIISFGYLAYAFGMVMTQSFNGAGDTATPTIINFFCYWIIEIPVAYFLAISLGINEKGVYYSIIIADTILAIVAIIIFRYGKWKNRKV